MGMMSTYHGHNNPVYNAHKNGGTPYTQQNSVRILFSTVENEGT